MPTTVSLLLLHVRATLWVAVVLLTNSLPTLSLEVHRLLAQVVAECSTSTEALKASNSETVAVDRPTPKEFLMCNLGFPLWGEPKASRARNKDWVGRLNPVRVMI